MDLKTPINRVNIQLKCDPDEVLAELIGADFREYRRRWAEAEAGLSRPNFPLHLDVDLTHRCNLACIVCPAGSPKTFFPGFNPQEELPEALYIKALAEGAREGLYSLRLGVTGEPLLKHNIVDWVKGAKEAGVLDISLITNGQLLSPELIEGLVKAGLTRLMISIDAATEETYKVVRPGGSWQRLNENLNFLADYKKRQNKLTPLVRLSFIRLSLNQGEEEAFKEHFYPVADYFSFQNYQNLWGTEKTDFFQGHEIKVDNGNFCPDPYTRLTLLSDGRLFPCCSDFARLNPVANIKDVSLKTAWRNQEVLEAIKNNQLLSCQKCRAASFGPGKNQK